MIDIYESKFILIYSLILSFVLGSVFGSFLNCMADRIKEGIPWWKGNSKCDNCGHKLSILDLFPIFSYLFLKGKCRYCGKKMSIKYLISEIVLGLLFVFFLINHPDINLDLFDGLGLICILFGLSLCDLNTYEIPDGFIIFGCIWWLLFKIIRGFSFKLIGLSILSAFIVSFAVLLISLIMDKILGNETLGGGDVKLLFLCGLYLNLIGSIFNIFLACIMGLVFILFLKKDKIPFGPCIALATYFSLIYGTSLLNWYYGLFLI